MRGTRARHERAAQADAAVAAERMTVRALVRAAAVAGAFTVVFCWVFARPLLDGSYLSESDLYDYYLPVFLAPPAVWSSYEFAGMPAFADPENSAFYPLHLLFARLVGSWTGFIASSYVLAACFMYAYVYHHTRSVRAALLSGLSYSMSEALLERLAHPSIVHVLAWLPLILLALDKLREAATRWTWVAIGAFAAASCVLAGHPQVPVYLAYLCGAYVVVGAVADRWPPGAWIAAAVMAGTAVLLGGVTLWPLVEISSYMARQTVPFDEFVSYSNTPAQMLSIVFPTVTHIGREAPTYVGLVALMLAPLGVWKALDWRPAFWAIVAVVALALGAGASTPLAGLAYALPLHDSFRIVARHLILAAFALTALAGFGFAAIAQGRAGWRTAAVSVGGTFFLMIAGAAVIAAHPNAVGFDEVDEALRLPFWNGGVWRQLGAAVMLGAVCMACVRRPRSTALTAVLLLAIGWDLARAFPGELGLLGLDLETVSHAALEPSVHARRLKAELNPLRQRLFTPGGAQTNEIVPVMFSRVWEIPTSGGNSSVAIDSMSTLAMLSQVRSGDRAVLSGINTALDMLAVKYVVFRAATMTDAERELLADTSRWREAWRASTSRTTDRGADESLPNETEYVIVENLRALPGAWLAREVLPLTDGGLIDAAFGSRLRDGRRFAPADMALVDEGQLPPRVYGEGPRDARVTSAADGVVRVRVSSQDGGFLVLSEAYYPGWRARIDDGPFQPVHRVDLALQGVEVPPGEHLVSFEFESRSRNLGLAASAAGVLLVAGIGAIGLRAPAAAAGLPSTT